MCEGCDRNNWNKERGISEFDEYQSFYERLVLLKYMMYTDTAEKLTEHRQAVMEGFLDEFVAEWEEKHGQIFRKRLEIIPQQDSRMAGSLYGQAE